MDQPARADIGGGSVNNPAWRLRTVDRLRALQGAQASRGIFITTSSFSADARSYADRINARLVLIDGPELARLMVEHNCGVRVEEAFALKQVDEDFFDET
jgi:restriction system protein